MSVDDDEISLTFEQLSDEIVRSTPLTTSDPIGVALIERAKSLSFEPTLFSPTSGRDPKSSCFLDGNRLELNLETLRRISRASQNKQFAPGLNKVSAKRVALSLFALHEAFHDVQGLANYRDVALVKASTGKRQLTRLDLKADLAATRALAFLDSRDADTGGYFRSLIANLDIATTMSLQVFPPSTDNPYKVSRVLSLYLTKNAILQNLDTCHMEIPLRYASLSEDFGTICVYDIGDVSVEKLLTCGTLQPESQAIIAQAVESKNLVELEKAMTHLPVFA